MQAKEKSNPCELASENREWLIDLVGKSGRNGRFGGLTMRVEGLEAAEREFRKLLQKLFLASVAASGVGAAIAHAILRAL